MKQKISLALLVVWFIAIPAKAEDFQFANISITVWRLENSPAEACAKMNTPIPDVFRSSWLYKTMVFKLEPDSEHKKVFSRSDYSFVLNITADRILVINILAKHKELLEFAHKRPSSAKYIFYGENSRPYMLEVLYTLDSRPVPLFTPGILKRF